MCGRYALYAEERKLRRRFGVEPPEELRPRYNVAPTQMVPILRREGEERRFAMVRWGLVPHWAKSIDTGYSTINARAETVADKPTYRSAFRRRRCLIPADGFYEWQTRAGTKVKQPWFIALSDGEPMALAGLWERWTSPEGAPLDSCCIIVTAANDLMRPIHDRMPVILASEHWERWLDPDLKDPLSLLAVLTPFPAEAMTAWPVGTGVNSPRNDRPECVERVADAPTGDG